MRIRVDDVVAVQSQPAILTWKTTATCCFPRERAAASWAKQTRLKTGHFFAVAAQIMRHILLDAARKRVTAKRGGDSPRVNLDEIADLSMERGNEVIALDDALARLAQLDPRKAQVIELRFFGGLSVEETAAVLKVSGDTVTRDWRLARAWLMNELSGRA